MRMFLKNLVDFVLHNMVDPYIVVGITDHHQISTRAMTAADNPRASGDALIEFIRLIPKSANFLGFHFFGIQKCRPPVPYGKVFVGPFHL